jgi:hypothetical protein
VRIICARGKPEAEPIFKPVEGASALTTPLRFAMLHG